MWDTETLRIWFFVARAAKWKTLQVYGKSNSFLFVRSLLFVECVGSSFAARFSGAWACLTMTWKRVYKYPVD